MQFADSCFDMVLDKGSLDVLMGEVTESSLPAISYLSEVCVPVRGFLFGILRSLPSGFEPKDLQSSSNGHLKVVTRLWKWVSLLLVTFKEH